MQFRRMVDVGGDLLVIALSSDIESRGSLFEISGNGFLLETYEGSGIRLVGDDNWLVNPAFIQTTAEVEIYGYDKTSSIILNAYPYDEVTGSENETKITFPSLSLLKAAAVCAETNLSDIPNQISGLADDEAAAVWEYLNLISDVVSYEDYLSIIESLSEISPSFRFELSKNVGNQIKQMLTGWESNATFRITSYGDLESRIEDFKNLSTIQKLPQTIEKEEVLANALAEVQIEGTLQDIIDLCRALDLAKHHPDLIQHHQARAIMAQSLIEEDLGEAWQVAKACFDFERTDFDKTYDEISEVAIDETDYGTRAEVWASAIMAASGDYETNAAIANYLYWTARTTDGHPHATAQLYDAAFHGFRRIGVTHMAQHAKYNHYAQLGYAHRQKNEYGLASDQFLQAYAVVSNANNEFDHRQSSQCITATRNWATACGDHYRFQGEYKMGINVLEMASESIEIMDSDDNDGLEHTLQLLQAKKRVLEMEQYLTQTEYELALETAGNIIGIYAELDDRGSQKWAITIRKEIKAIVYETNGDLSQAAALHREIGDSESISEQRQDWHIHRGDICEAKQLALDTEYKRAKAQLLEIQKRTNRLESEANDLSIVLDSVLTYLQGQQTSFQEAIQRLSQSDDHDRRVPPMKVEYNYEEPLSVIHAAQWLRSYNVDEELLSMAVEVALQASLIPLHAGEAAASIGIDEVDLRDQWVNQLPAPVAKRIKQIELDMTVPQTDYVGLGSRLFNLVELYLAIIGEYFGTRKWGSGWREKLSDSRKTKNMALGDLANVFDRCDEYISSSDVTKELVNGDGQTPSVIKLRNDIGHIKTDDVDTTQFNRFYDRVMNIFRTTADDVPVIGRKVETRGQGGFQRELVQLQWWRSVRLLYIQTEAELTDGELYYFPQTSIDVARKNGSVSISSEAIVRVSTDRVLDKF